jgi:peptide/nickel transport system ATP-binding protein
MAEKLIEIKNLFVEYRSMNVVTKAVNGISFDLEPSDVLGLVGETGAGKTTIALSIMQLLPKRVSYITGGQILYEGTDLLKFDENHMRTIRGRNISMIFQDPMTSLNPVITVGEQVEESLRFHNTEGKTSAEMSKRVDEIFGLVGISASRKHEYPYQFSGGMKQRLVIALALACNPALLIADEPTTALDVTIQAQVLAMIQELQQKQKTAMILITHDLGIVAQICKHVAVMYAGEIVETGTVYDLFGNSKHHPYTTGLLNSIPSLVGDEKRLNPIEGLIPDPTHLPEGCKFHPRCPYCMDRCKVEKPVTFVDGTHKISCFMLEGTNE